MQLGMSALCHKRSYAESRLTDRVRPKADLTRRRAELTYIPMAVIVTLTFVRFSII